MNIMYTDFRMCLQVYQLRLCAYGMFILVASWLSLCACFLTFFELRFGPQLLCFFPRSFRAEHSRMRCALALVLVVATQRCTSLPVARQQTLLSCDRRHKSLCTRYHLVASQYEALRNLGLTVPDVLVSFAIAHLARYIC